MPFELLAPMIATDNMDRSVRFYVDVLGFTCAMETPGFSTLERGRVRIMLTPPWPGRSWNGAAFTGQLYIYLNGPGAVDALWNAIGGRAEVIYPPEDFSYGMREFGIRDDSGYHLALGASIADPPVNPC